MSFEEYWDALVAKNPSLGGEDEDVIKLRLRGLKAMVKQAWEKGEDLGVEEASNVHTFNNKGSGTSSASMPDFLQSFFGGAGKH